MINTDSIVCISKEIHITNLDGDKVMMDLEKGKYFALNSIGSRIWDLAKNEISLKEVVSKLLEEYEVDKETCEKTVIEFIKKMNKEKLIFMCN
ncbi:MAG: lasso peptide biosynthesis PqqD family chaperone [Clostridium sp.]